MHVFLLILSIAGQPERIGAICNTYQKCSDQGAQYQAAYAAEHHVEPKSVGFRVVPGIIAEVKDGGTDT